MSALAEQVARYSEARARLGYPVTPVKRVRLNPVPVTPPELIAAEPAPDPKPLPTAQRARLLPSTRAHWMAIVQEVALKHDIDIKSILGPARNRHISRARNECFYRMRSEIIVAGEPMSLPEIARRFSGRDHTTALHGIRVHCRENGLSVPKGRFQLSPLSTQLTRTRTKPGLARLKIVDPINEQAHSGT